MIDYRIDNWIDCWIKLGEGRKGGGVPARCWFLG